MKYSLDKCLTCNGFIEKNPTDSVSKSFSFCKKCRMNMDGIQLDELKDSLTVEIDKSVVEMLLKDKSMFFVESFNDMISLEGIQKFTMLFSDTSYQIEYEINSNKGYVQGIYSKKERGSVRSAIFDFVASLSIYFEQNLFSKDLKIKCPDGVISFAYYLNPVLLIKITL